MGDNAPNQEEQEEQEPGDNFSDRFKDFLAQERGLSRNADDAAGLAEEVAPQTD